MGERHFDFLRSLREMAYCCVGQCVCDDGNVIAEGFVTQTMIAAIEREMAADRSTNGQQAMKHDRTILGRPETETNDTGLTTVEVVKRLKITKPTVLYLCKNGLLAQPQNRACRRAGSLSICGEPVANFEKTFVSLGNFAAQSTCRRGALAIRLKNAGTQMLAMPPKYSRIFWRVDFES